MDIAITELEKIDADRIDGVDNPANGIPILLMKAVADVAKGQRDCPECDKSYDADHQGGKCENCGTKLPDADASKAAADDKTDCPTCDGDGKIMAGKRDCPDCDASGKVTPAKAKQLAAKSLVRGIISKAADRKGNIDETPDIAGGTAVLAQIADLIIAEAGELKAGQAGEISDILQLACAAEAIWCWRTGEESAASGSVMPATALMQSAAVSKDRNYSDGERKEMAGDGRALPDGSYPINDEHDLNSAAILARSGHGDVPAATKHIGKRAKELGVKNPLDDNTDGASKGAVAEGEGTVDTVTKETGSQIAKAVEDAVMKATAPLKERIESLSEELAKVKATPVPGGPHMSVVAQRPKAPDGEEWTAKSVYYRQMADSVNDPETADGYRQLARQAEDKAKA